MQGTEGWTSPMKGRVDLLLREFVARADELLHAQEQMNGLLAAVVSIAEDLSLEAVLDRVVNSACLLLDARFGALGVIGRTSASATSSPLVSMRKGSGRSGTCPPGMGYWVT